MSKSEQQVIYTSLPQYVVDEALSKRDAAYRELDTEAVYLEVQKYSIELKIEKLNSTEIVKYYLH